MYDSFEQKGKIFTDVITKKPVDIVLQTNNNIIQGKIHVKLNQRLKDELDSGSPFLAITEATILTLSGNKLYQCQFIAVNRSHIVWLIPQKEITNSEDK